jgi:hypothetical protein
MAIVMKLCCSCIHSPSFYQDLAGDRSRGGPQHRRDTALAVKEGKAHFGGDTEVRNTVTLIAEKHMAHNRGHDT